MIRINKEQKKRRKGEKQLYLEVNIKHSSTECDRNKDKENSSIVVEKSFNSSE